MIKREIDSFFSKGFGEWSLPAIEKFKELMATQVESTALINPETEEEGCVSVILLYNDSDDNYTINEMLVGLRLASSLVFTQVAEPVNKIFNDTQSLGNRI